MRILMILCGFAFLIAACQKDDYYEDGGLANAHFDGTVLEYLDANPVHFDTIAQLIRLAGLEEVFNNDELTFFAPNDRNVRELIGDYRRGGVNTELYRLNRDTIEQLSDVDSLIWRKYLMRYMFRGKNLLADYRQVDFDLLDAYPGQNYYSYNNSVCNIGVRFHDEENGESIIKYGGYRQLYISFIPDVSQPFSNWSRVQVISSDIQPTNGVVHALYYLDGTFFGLDNQIYDDIVETSR